MNMQAPVETDAGSNTDSENQRGLTLLSIGKDNKIGSFPNT